MFNAPPVMVSDAIVWGLLLTSNVPPLIVTAQLL
jgi:hypothetical protein